MVQPRIGDGETVGMMVRMSSGLRDRIKAAAESNGRSQNSEIVATLEEKYPAPVRTFSFAKWQKHKEAVDRRASEILREMDENTAKYSTVRSPAELDKLQARFTALSAEFDNLLKYDIEDDQFHDIEYPTDD